MPLVRPTRCQTGFSLIELLAVMAVLAVLFGASVGLVRGAKQRTAIGQARGELVVIAQALEAYRHQQGDYPHTGHARQAPAEIYTRIEPTDAQALLFNSLAGGDRPGGYVTSRAIPSVLSLATMRLEVPFAGVDEDGGKQSQLMQEGRANSLLDPWGRRYLYYYKAALALDGGGDAWKAGTYVFYSAGPDGQHSPPASDTGIFTEVHQRSGVNADNLYATP